jgi:hypothetical protein
MHLAKIFSDQYGGLLAFNALVYRYPRLMPASADAGVILSNFAALGVPFLWKVVVSCSVSAPPGIAGSLRVSEYVARRAMREPYLLRLAHRTMGFQP